MIMGLRTTALVMAAAANTVAVNLKCPCDLRTATNGRTTPSTARSSSTVAFVATGSRTLSIRREGVRPRAALLRWTSRRPL
jgi:hypothetical protein